jgi:hypothetical protein
MGAPADALVPRALFGGALELALPARLVDVSDFRPVPDAQEVWADGDVDQSLVVEALELAAGVPDAEAAAFYFADLATANGAAHAAASAAELLHPGALPGVPPARVRAAGLLVGEQAVAKSRDAALNKVQVCLLVLRLPDFATDLLLTLNTPVFVAEGSSGGGAAGLGFRPGALEAPALFRRIVATLRIVDFGLFGGAGGGGGAA